MTKSSRFQMPARFASLPGAEGWQLSNPPILQLAALRASMELFAEAGMGALEEKRERLSSFLHFLLAGLPGTPSASLPRRTRSSAAPSFRIRIRKDARTLVQRLAGGHRGGLSRAGHCPRGAGAAVQLLLGRLAIRRALRSHVSA